MIFYTPSAGHLAQTVGLPQGNVTFRQFSDGELYVRVNEKVRAKEVWVVAATNPPAENLLELAFMIDALQRGGAIINLFITYFGYARQDRASSGEALGSQVFGNLIKSFTIKELKVIQIHNPAVQKYFYFNDIIPWDFFYTYAKDADVIVAPDHGAFILAKAIAKQCDKEAAYVEKVRKEHDVSKVSGFKGQVNGKKALIVDDLISTGGTLINAAQTLIDHGAAEVKAAATHGIFAKDALDRFAQSPLKKVVVTNSVEQKKIPDFLEIYDLGSLIRSEIK